MAWPRLKNRKIELRVRLDPNEPKDWQKSREILKTMETVNRLCTLLSKGVQYDRIFGMSEMLIEFGNDFKAIHGINNRTMELVALKVAKAYEKEKKKGHRFLGMRPPLRFSKHSPIYLRQKYFSMREYCTMNIQTLDGSSVTSEVVFGRYRNPKRLNTHMTGTAQLRYTARKGFRMTLEVETPAGVPFNEDDLGIENGVIATMVSPLKLLNVIEERRYGKKSPKLKPKEADTERSLLWNIMDMARDTVEDAITKKMDDLEAEEKPLIEVFRSISR